MLKNVIVGQSGGPTAVINASLAGVFTAGKDMGLEHIYGMRYGIQGLYQGESVDLSGILQSSQELQLLKTTPASFLGSCRYKLPQIGANNQVYEELFRRLEQLSIDALFYIGGNDSMDTIQKLSAYGNQIGSDIRFIGIPKTIDNDLAMTDHTPGFGSAAKFIAATVKETVRDCMVYNLESVTLVEIMGRNAGWLTGAASLAQGDDCEGAALICLPEVPFDMNGFLLKTKRAIAERGSIVIALAEGIKVADGRYVCELGGFDGDQDMFGRVSLTGTARYLSNVLGRELGCKTRAIELNTLQRCAAHFLSATDVEEAFLAGQAAVETAAKGKTGRMIAFTRLSQNPYRCGLEDFDINSIANAEKTVPLDWIGEDGMSVKPELTDYIRPLIQGEVAPVITDGLPKHIKL